MIDWTKPVETDEDNPRPVRVLCTDGPNRSYPVQVICGNMAQSTGYSHDGRSSYGLERHVPLRNVAPKPVRYEGWVVLYNDGSICASKRENATDFVDNDRVETRRIVWHSDGSPVDTESCAACVNHCNNDRACVECSHYYQSNYKR